MSRLYMLDTNTVSYILKGKSPAARARLAKLGDDDVACISIVTEFELEFGLAKNPDSDNLRRAVRGFLSRIRILQLGSAEARVYGQLRVRQQAAGRPLESMDMLIAAHALASNCTVVTDKERAFGRVSGLRVENWLR